MLVAVYGSLRKSLHNHRLLEEATFLGTTTTSGFTMYSLGGFPYLTPSDNTNPITIEVYDVTEREFANLDRLEGFPNFYNRKLIPTEFGEAWIYFIATASDDLVVTSGDWLTYYQEKSHAYSY